MMLGGIEKGRSEREGASMVSFSVGLSFNVRSSFMVSFSVALSFSVAFDITVREGERHSPSIGGTLCSGALTGISSHFT